MEYQVEDAVRIAAQVGHVTLVEAQLQALTVGHPAIDGQLPGRQVQHRDTRAGGGQYRRLLAPAGSETQDLKALETREPVRGRVPVGCEPDCPAAGAGRRDDVRGYGRAPALALGRLPVPRAAIQSLRVQGSGFLVDAEVADLAGQRVTADAQQGGGLLPVAARPGERGLDQGALESWLGIRQ